MVNIKECQIYQASPEKVVFRIVRGMSYMEEDEKRLLLEARQRLGEKLEIEISYVESIERTRTGKLRFVVSGLPQSQIRRGREVLP
jgi:phenylacetate-CoA ligase